MEGTTRLIIIEEYDRNEFRKEVEEHINALKKAHWDIKVTYQSECLELYPTHDNKQGSSDKYTAFIEYNMTNKTERTLEVDEPLNDPYRYER